MAWPVNATAPNGWRPSRQPGRKTPEIEEDPYFFDPGDWGWLRDALFPVFFHIGVERDMAWEKAGLISGRSGLSLKSLDQALRASLNAVHPSQEPFAVGDDEMKGYDWTKQPGAPTSVPGPRPTGASPNCPCAGARWPNARCGARRPASRPRRHRSDGGGGQVPGGRWPARSAANV